MASTDKTPKLGLNQWAAGDDVLRADFNADNAKIEAEIEAVRAAAAAAATAAANAVVKMVSGQFPGDNTDLKTVDVGFKPRMVMLAYPASDFHVDIFNEKVVFQFFGNTGGVYGTMIENSAAVITDTGFRIKSAYNNQLKFYGHYIAFA